MKNVLMVTNISVGDLFSKERTLALSSVDTNND